MKRKYLEITYVGCSKDQIRWGSNDDPRELLTVGETYNVTEIRKHSWHTKYELREHPGKFFNSVCFK